MVSFQGSLQNKYVFFYAMISKKHVLFTTIPKQGVLYKIALVDFFTYRGNYYGDGINKGGVRCEI